ncbi:PREDICTED: chymotrypsin-2-like [Ceratosolen solmsi marchali]|uniref:Chymotrypsin-2-like n=1 Tax=Ceratosolen solmsi marchali TaxID=326594 RepID=A0AAJ6YUW5_9HYME|nr:PREDICTED: chymotrypsin-2-like [Ceratosolen solmsi marchali]
MRNLITVFVFALLTIGSSAKNVRIVGGQETNPRKYPFVAAFKHVSDPNFFCSGAILSHKHIVTTAQCMRKFFRDLTNVTIYTGIVSLESNELNTYQVARAAINRRYTGKKDSDEAYLHDIAVVKVKGEIHFDEFQNKIELLDRDVTASDRGVLLGWGAMTYPEYSYPVKLRKAAMKIVPQRFYYKHFTFLIHDTQFMALRKAGVGACKGDNGAPFVIDGKLAGLASVIDECAEGIPEIHTKIHYYVDFIRDMMNY